MAILRYSHSTPFDPFQGLAAWGLTGFQGSPSRPVAQAWVPPVDIRETENELIVKADIPEVKFEDIDVHLENGALTIRGERKFAETTEEKTGWHRTERAYGKFERSFKLPDTVDPEGVKADYKDGTLTVTLPKKAIAKPRQVKVQVGAN